MATVYYCISAIITYLGLYELYSHKAQIDRFIAFKVDTINSTTVYVYLGYDKYFFHNKLFITEL